MRGSELVESKSLKREAQLVIAHLEGVAVADHFALHALSVVLDAVRRTHVDDVVLPRQKLDHGVLTRHVRIFDGQITGLLAAADDEAVLRDLEDLTLVGDGQRA